LSNESDIPVYFDNFNIAYTRGRIIEENHYYAYGLKIAGISSKKLGDPNEGSLKNNNLYNDKEIDDEADLDWLDYGFRNYDPQIGRFVQIDPLVDETPVLSGYHYALNDPITNIDEDGLSGLSVVQQVACWTGQTVGSVKLMGTVNEITHIIAV
jgi:RHS repeat-associated protein